MRNRKPQTNAPFPHPQPHETIHWRPYFDTDEIACLNHFLPVCRRQTTGDSSGPEVNICGYGLRYGHTVRDVSKLQSATWSQYPINFFEDSGFVGAQIYI